MYSPGDVKIVWDAQQHSPIYTDDRSDEELSYPVVFLPHSDHQWVIGGLQELAIMIHELQLLESRMVARHLLAEYPRDL